MFNKKTLAVMLLVLTLFVSQTAMSLASKPVVQLKGKASVSKTVKAKFVKPNFLLGPGSRIFVEQTVD